MAIGQDLLDLPFAEMVRNLSFAIAEGQLELDRSSIQTLQFLIGNTIQVVPEVAEIVEPSVRPITVSGRSGPVTIPVTGVTLRATGAQPMTLNLLQAGILPTFYQFTEAQIEVKLSISMRRTEERETTGSGRLGVQTGGYRALAFASSVNFRTANTYSYAAQGASVLRATMRPVPPPPRLIPRTVTINTLVSPPTVTVTE